MPIKRSVTDDYIVCLEDGKQLKVLKRHLMTAYGMTPEQYRAKWGLPLRLPDGGAELLAEAAGAGEGDRPWTQAGSGGSRSQADGQAAEGQGEGSLTVAGETNAIPPRLHPAPGRGGSEGDDRRVRTVSHRHRREALRDDWIVHSVKSRAAGWSR